MRSFPFFLLSILCFSFKIPEPKIKTNASLKSVTVYRSGANMEHTAFANLNSGNSELIIEGISSYVDINSIQINCPSQVTILGIEFSNDYLSPENQSPEILILKDSLDKLVEEISKINIQITTSSDMIEILRVNRDIKGSQTGVSVAELAKLMEYYKTQSLLLQNNILKFRKQKTELEKRQSSISNQIVEEQKKNTKSSGRLIIQLSSALAGSYEFKINYISQNAFWTPYYDIRAENIKSPLKFMYKAKISQSTGIDWKKVKLFLSTATPKNYGTAPTLQTWFLGYINPVNYLNRSLAKANTIPAYKEYDAETSSTKLESVVIRGQGSISSNSQPLYIVNGVPMEKSEFDKISPNSIKSTEILKDGAATALYGSRGSAGVIIITLKDGLEDYITVSSSELDVTYEISIPYDVPTTGKPQIATLKEAVVPASYKYYAVPKLQSDAFLLAEVTDWQSLNLLPGEANIIFEGTYIGKSFIDPFSLTDTLNLTLGVDKRVVIKKEKLTDFSSVKFLGSNKIQTITYELTVKNNKSEPINIIIKDQYPVSTNKEIDVNLLQGKDGSVNEETGIITWTMQVAPGKSEKRRMSYSVKYPKDKIINIQ